LKTDNITYSLLFSKNLFINLIFNYYEKNYLFSIILVFFVSLTGFSQVTSYDFNVYNGGWSAKNYCQLASPDNRSSKINIAKYPNQTPTNDDGSYERANNGHSQDLILIVHYSLQSLYQ
jgi:hypothetical protein